MKTQFILAHIAWTHGTLWPWSFIMMVALLIFVTLVVSEGSSKGEDK